MFNPIPIKREGKIIGYSIGGTFIQLKNYHYVTPLLTVVSRRNQVGISRRKEDLQ